MLEQFYIALRDKLITDSVLLTLTGDNRASNPPVFRIFQDKPEKVAAYPSLCFSVDHDEDFDESSSLGLKRTFVDLTAQAKGTTGEITVVRICDRLDILSKQYGKQQHLQWFDISNNQVTNKMTKYTDRNKTNFDSKTDVWSQSIVLEFNWHLKNPTIIGV